MDRPVYGDPMRRGGPALAGVVVLAAALTAPPAQAAARRAPAHPASALRSAAPAVAGTFRPVQTWRLLDTRSGLGAPRAALAPAGTVDLTVTGRAGIPTSGVSAVAINLTALGSTGRGYLTAYAQGATRPTTSNLNYLKAQTRANLAVVPVSAGGAISLYNGSAGSVQVLGDVEGYYLDGSATAPGSFSSLAPARLLDTRNGTGAAPRPVPAAGDVSFPVAGQGGVPSTGATAVVLNLTATASTSTGYLTAYASGSARPAVSTLNFGAGQTTPNLAVVRVGADGRVVVHNGSSGHTDVVADVSGYYLAGSGTAVGAYVPVTPKRVIDSRTGVGSPKKQLPGGYELISSIGLPSNATAAVLNLTATGAHKTGFLAAPPQFPLHSGSTADPALGTRTSTLSYSPGLTVANLVVIPLRRGQTVVYNGGGGAVDVVADVLGYTLAPVITWSAPTRLAMYSVLDVSCTSATFCAAIDNSDSASVYNGTTWTKTTTIVGDADAMHGSISCVSPTFCLGAHLDLGGNVNAFTYNGTTWSGPTALGGTFTGQADDTVSVSCASTTFCVAGFHGLRMYDGASWSALVTPSGLSSVTGVSCPTTTFCMAVDRDARATTFNGVSWSAARSLVEPSTIEATYSVSCTAPAFCLAASFYGSYAWDGRGWNVVNNVSADDSHRLQLLDVSCASPTFCAGASQSTYTTLFTGGAWTSLSALNAKTARAVSCPSESFCAMVDDGYVYLGTA